METLVHRQKTGLGRIQPIWLWELEKKVHLSDSRFPLL